jgi:hypothetical protein
MSIENNDTVTEEPDVSTCETKVECLAVDVILPPVQNPTFKPSDIIRTALTGADNISADISHITLILGSLTIVGLQIYVTLTTGVFDIINFAGGYTAVSAGGAWAIKHKASTEPSPQ